MIPQPREEGRRSVRLVLLAAALRLAPTTTATPPPAPQQSPQASAIPLELIETLVEFSGLVAGSMAHGAATARTHASGLLAALGVGAEEQVVLAVLEPSGDGATGWALTEGGLVSNCTTTWFGRKTGFRLDLTALPEPVLVHGRGIGLGMDHGLLIGECQGEVLALLLLIHETIGTGSDGSAPAGRA